MHLGKLMRAIIIIHSRNFRLELGSISAGLWTIDCLFLREGLSLFVFALIAQRLRWSRKSSGVTGRVCVPRYSSAPARRTHACEVYDEDDYSGAGHEEAVKDIADDFDKRNHRINYGHKLDLAFGVQL